MAALTVETSSRSGLTPTHNACDAGGDEFVNDGGVMVWVTNGGASERTVTIVSQETVDGLAVADRTVAVPAGEERLIGPFPVSTYNDANSKVQLTYDAVTSLTIAVIKRGT